VRIIAATNRDLDAAIRERTFRQDLYYRLNTFTIRLPPLRDRPDDIFLLAEHIAQQNRERLGTEVRGFAPETLAALKSYSWPGNVRELESAIKYALVHTVGETITPEALPVAVTGTSTTQPGAEPPRGDLPDVRQLVRSLLANGHTSINDLVHADVDRALLDEVLRHAGGQQTRAAELLGVSRTTLRMRLQQLGISVEKTVRTGD
jgi:two-component system nitrogen regulation response regulator GlnG